MFEKITLRSGDRDTPDLTFGRVVEALVYYNKVHLFLNFGSAQTLCKQIGHENFLDLLGRPEVTCSYSPEFLGVHTKTDGGLAIHEVVAAQLHGQKLTGKPLRVLAERVGLSGRQAEQFQRRFRAAAQIISLGSSTFVPGGVPMFARSQLSDREFMRSALTEILRLKSGVELPTTVDFDILPASTGFLLASSLDWAALNSKAAIANPSAGQLTPANILTAFHEAMGDLVICSHYGSEYVCSPSSSAVMKMKFNRLLRHIDREREQIDAFEEIVLDGLPSIQAAVDVDKSYSEAMKLVDASTRFKSFTSQLGPDAKLLAEYLAEASRVGPSETMVGKVFRFVGGTAVGAFNPVVGAGLSAVDVGFGDKILKGWRPHHFVEKRLKPFLGS